VAGGMHALAQAVEKLARARGVVFRYGCAVSEIEVQDGRACGVRVQPAGAGWAERRDSERLAADAVVFNGDASALAQGLLGPASQHAAPGTAPKARSLSALTWALKVRTTGFPLERHNVFFHGDYASEFDDIFRRDRLPRAGTVYLCAQDRGAGSSPAPGDTERLLMLVNAPAHGDRTAASPTEIDTCEQTSLALLSRCGLTILRRPQAWVRTTPQDFAARYPATGGALYGPASHGWMALFRRGAAASRLPGLYLTGGSVHPGPGVPMAAMSGQLAAATLLAHLDSTSRSQRVVISGGMSTRSATTVATG